MHYDVSRDFMGVHGNSYESICFLHLQVGIIVVICDIASLLVCTPRFKATEPLW